MGQVSVNLPASLRSTAMLLRTLSADRDSALRRLVSGQKINNSIDGPNQYFAARTLNQRAGDLDALKSGMAQAISTIRAASKGTESVKAVLDQARGLTTVALSTLDNTPSAIAMRRELATQFNGILTQIDKIAADSAYGGKNLLRARPATFAAGAEGLLEASDITGMDKVQVTGVIGANSYRVHVSGNGQITGDAGDIKDAQSSLGFAQLSLSGFNSEETGRLDDIRFELHGKPGRDARLVVLDGDESWTTTYSDAQLKALGESGEKLSIGHAFGSGARVTLMIDGDRLREALTPGGLVTANVRRDVDLNITVTNNQGVTLSRSADTQDGAERLRQGENSFRFDQGTVRLSIDPATIQGAAETQGGVDGDMGSFTGTLLPGTPTTLDKLDTFVRLEVARSGFGAGAVVLNQYSRPKDGQAVWSQINGNQANVVIGGGAANASAANLAITPGSLTGSTSSGVFLFNRNAGAGGLSTVADGDFDAGEFANPNVSGWNQSAQLTITYGVTSGGARSVTVSDGLGGSVNGQVEDKGDGQPSVIRLQGGVNDGATIGLFHKSAAAGTRQIDVLVGLNSYAVASDAASQAAAGLDDLASWAGFGVDSDVGIAVGGANSAGLGFRTVSITQSAIGGGGAGVNNFVIANGAANDLTFGLGNGPSPGAQVRFDVGAGAANFAFRVAAMDATVTRAAELTIRSASEGEAASIATEQISVATPENDLTVNLNGNRTSQLTINAVNLGSGPLGLGIDLASNEWRDRSDVTLAIDDLTRADSRLQSALRSLDVNLDILNSRADFTSEFAATLREGADRLLASDRNVETAQVLTADLRSQLAGTMMSLMVQSQQRILSLF